MDIASILILVALAGVAVYFLRDTINRFNSDERSDQERTTSLCEDAICRWPFVPLCTALDELWKSKIVEMERKNRNDEDIDDLEDDVQYIINERTRLVRIGKEA